MLLHFSIREQDFAFRGFETFHALPSSVATPHDPPSNRFSTPLSAQAAHSKPRGVFRSKANRRALHPLERTALCAIGVHLAALPWMFGTTRPWPQWISFGLAAIGFVISLIPRNYTEEHTGSNRFRLVMWPRLVKFPIFWLGLTLLGYIALQALNPAWTYESNGKAWWMRKIDAKPWLPNGVIAPFEKWNQWRMLVIYGSGLMSVSAIWVAFTRRWTLQLFLTGLAINGLLVSILGLAERISKAEKLYWFFETPNSAFFGSFVYKNHGAAYVYLTLVVTCGLASWYHVRGLRRMEKSNPAGLFVLCAMIIAGSVLVSYARGISVLMLAFLFGSTTGFAIHQALLPKESRRPIILVALALVFGFFAKTGFEAIRPEEAWNRVKQGVTQQDDSLASRLRVTTAAKEMLRDDWKMGVGAGAFRFLFPIYQFRHPELVSSPYGVDTVQLYWEHAHNDIIQFPIELGFIGCGLLSLGVTWWAAALIKARFWDNSLSVCITFGASLILLYAWWDFPFQCPAVLITWCVLWVAATMWAQFESAAEKG